MSVLGLFALCMMFCACPFESKVPIDSKALKIDQKLLGKWSTNNGSNDEYTVSRSDDHSYSIKVHNLKEKSDKNWVAFATLVNGKTFLNICEYGKGPQEKKFLFAKIEIQGNDQMMVETVTEKINKVFKTSAEEKKYFADNMTSTHFFDAEKITLTRIGNEPQ